MSDFVAGIAAPGPYGVIPYRPGKPVSELEREYGITDAVKLASNENPLGPSPLAVAAMGKVLADASQYPDSNGCYLKAKLAERYSVSAEQLVLGNGSNDILELIARAFLTAETSAVMSAHCFTVYPTVTVAAGARVIEVPPRQWGHDLAAMADAVTDDTRVIFIANPNNPTGTSVGRAELSEFLARLPAHLVVVLDEAYIDYIEDDAFPNGLEWLSTYRNLVVLRTFSKIYGLAGVRIGFGVADEQVIELLNRIRQPFNINSLALVAAEAGLDDEQHLQQSRQVNQSGLQQLATGLTDLGLGYIPSNANFITVDLCQPAAPVYFAMLKRGVIVRPIENYRMPQHLRISVGLESENRRCLQALTEALDELQ